MKLVIMTKKYFDLIKSGEKTTEIRNKNSYPINELMFLQVRDNIGISTPAVIRFDKCTEINKNNWEKEVIEKGKADRKFALAYDCKYSYRIQTLYTVNKIFNK